MQGKTHKLMIVDDHPILRQGLKMLLKEYKFKIIYEASNGRQAIEMLEGIQPDIILMDIDMPEMNGLEAIKIIKQKYPIIKIIILTGHYYKSYVAEMVKVGADAFMPKNCTIDDLVKTFDYLNQKKPYIYPQINELSELNFTNIKQEEFELIIKQRCLTPMEIGVLIGLCNGRSRKEIAGKHQITTRTVSFHTENIYKKTKLTNKVELQRYAQRNGYLSV